MTNGRSEAADSADAPAHPSFHPADQQLRAVLQSAIASSPADGLLLSGGIDSTVLAALDAKIPAITVGLSDESDDIVAARFVAEALGIPWHMVELSRSQALEHLRELIKSCNSYNLELINNIPLHVGAQTARTLGMGSLRTGEFADELFRGYTYLYDYPNKKFMSEVVARARRYRPPSAPLFVATGQVGVYTYLSDPVVSYGARLSREDNVVSQVCLRDGDYHTALNGGPPGARMRRWGKAALRRAANGLVPERIVTRPKQDLMYGSGMMHLEEDLATLVTSNEVDDFEKQGRWFTPNSRSAHAGLYKLYIEAGMRPCRPSAPDERPCRGCGGAVRPVVGDYCPTCGRYPATMP